MFGQYLDIVSSLYVGCGSTYCPEDSAIQIREVEIEFLAPRKLHVI